MKEEDQPRPGVDSARRIQIGELTKVGALMTEEEMKAVSGAQKSLATCDCGSPRRTDDWVY